MIQKPPDDLRRFAIEVAQKTRKPFDDILLRETKTKTVTTEYKSGFLNLITKTKQETKKHLEEEKCPINCWILEKYTETDFECNQYFTSYCFYYVLKSNGDLNVITVRSNGMRQVGNTFYYGSSVEIKDMTYEKFLLARRKLMAVKIKE